MNPCCGHISICLYLNFKNFLISYHSEEYNLKLLGFLNCNLLKLPSLPLFSVYIHLRQGIVII